MDRGSRVAVAQGLLVWGLAAAALGLAAMNIADQPQQASFFTGRCALPAEEVTDLRAAAAFLLLCGATQALVATLALLDPQLTFVCVCGAWFLALPTSLRAGDVVLSMVACPGQLQGKVALQYWTFIFFLGAVLVRFVIVFLAA